MLERSSWKKCVNVRNKKLVAYTTAMNTEEWRQLLRGAKTFTEL
jgi:hypothetical protein